LPAPAVAGAGQRGQSAATLPIQQTDLPGGLPFSASTYSVGEKAGSATVTVTRTGGSVAPASVHYATSDGTAIAGSNYTSVSGTLSFAAGQTTATFGVPVLDDGQSNGDTSLTLTLSAPGGGATL